MSARLTITDMQSIAHHYGGKCLSKEYKNWFVPLKWMCEKGHTWDSSYSIVKQGWWCAQCVKNKQQEEYLEELKILAKKKGGFCLSEKYITNKTKLKFQCAQGHQWAMEPYHIKRGDWCVKCNKQKANEVKLSEVKLFAQKKGGKCLSLKYINNTQKLKWQCRSGHVWIMTTMQIKQGSWCQQCRKDKIKEGVFKEISAIAKKQGGKCLSPKYVYKSSSLKWQCSLGHEWSALANHIKAGQWCPTCGKEKRRTGLRKYSVSEIKKLALKRKIKLLSKEYINLNLLLTWECDKGHVWSASTYSVIIANSGCRPCLNESMKLSIEEFQQLAISRKGKLLSKEYISIGKHLEWQCEKGHKFSAVAASIKRGGWCGVCYRSKF